jgi:hypothetical protein
MLACVYDAVGTGNEKIKLRKPGCGCRPFRYRFGFPFAFAAVLRTDHDFSDGYVF